MSIVTRLAGAYEKLGGNLSRLPKEIRYMILAGEIANPTLESTSSYHKGQRALAAGLGALGLATATAFLLKPTSAYAASLEEKSVEEQKVPENLSLYNYAFGVGKVKVPRLGVSFVPELGSFKLRLTDYHEMIEEHTAVVRLAKDGIEYTVHKPIPNNFYGIGYEVDRGFIPYDKIEQVKREIEEKERKIPKWEKALGTFFIKTTPDSDDFKRDTINKMRLFAFDDFVKMNYAEAVPRDFKLPYSVMEHLLPNVESPQIPQGPKKLEEMLTEGYIELKQGTLYYKKADDGLINYRWLSGDFIEKEGTINLRAPTTNLAHSVIAGGILNSVRHKIQIEAEQYQDRIKKFSEEYKGFVLSVAPYVNKDELEKINFGMIAQGFLPVFIESDRVLAVQFSGRYAKVSNGDNVLEGALGVVVNQAIGKDSMTQFSIFYQHRYDVRSDAHFGAIGGTLALQTGDVTIDLYVNRPVTGRQKLKSERTTADTTSTTTSGGNTVTRTTRLETLITEYEEVRRVISLNLEYDFRNNPIELLRTLKLRGGVVWYSGRDNETTESGNVKRVVEGYSDELKAVLGFTYVIDELSRRLDQRIEAYGDIRVGQGKPQFEAGLRTWFGESYRDYLRRAGNGGIDLYRLARLIDLKTGRFKVTKETKNRSPGISGDCPTTGTVGVVYTCDLTADGTDFSSVLGIPSLTLTKTGEHTARYSGPPTSSDIGSHPIKIKATTNGLDSFKDYTLVISASAVSTPANHNPTLDDPGNKTVNKGSLLEVILSGSDPDNDPLTFSIDSGLQAGATFDAAAKKLSWTPSVNQTGLFTITYKVADNNLGTDTKTRTITVNQVNPSISYVSPASNPSIDAGDFVTFQYSTSHPFSVTVTTNKTTIAGTCPDVPNGTGPVQITFNVAATCDYSGTANDGGGGTATTVIRRITVGSGGG